MQGIVEVAVLLACKTKFNVDGAVFLDVFELSFSSQFLQNDFI